MCRSDVLAFALGLSASLATLVLPAAAGELADPTRPPEARLHPVDRADPGGPRLSAIYLSAEHSAALVDGRRVVPGDSVGGRRVEQIQRDRVVLNGTEGRLELRLAPSIRRSVSDRAGGEP